MPLNAATGFIGAGYYITINSNGAFFNTNVGVGFAKNYNDMMQLLQPASQGARTFIELHELAHFFQARGFIQNDNTKDKQAANNDLRWKNCSKTILAGQGGFHPPRESDGSGKSYSHA